MFWRHERTNRAAMTNVLLGLLLVTFLGTGCASFKGKPFTVVALPDTQVYAKLDPDLYLSQTQWIVDNREKHNIVCVLHEGDVTNENWKEQWDNADRAMSLLDGAVPYLIAIGNHDMGPSGNTIGRDSTLFNSTFPVSRFQDQPWYGGHFGDNNDNSYGLFDVSGMKLLVLALEFGPRDEVVEWANRIVEQHSDRQTIVVTHAYLTADNKLLAGAAPGCPHTYPCGGNDGQELWDKLVSKHPNIFLVLSGHMQGVAGRLTSTGEHGNTVHQMMANYQFGPNGGDGWLRVLTFVPEEDTIRVSTYSTSRKEEMTDEANTFELPYPMEPRRSWPLFWHR